MLHVFPECCDRHARAARCDPLATAAACRRPTANLPPTKRCLLAATELGLIDKASWHDRYKHCAYVFAGGLPFELTEGDLLAVFAQVWGCCCCAAWLLA